MDSKMIHTANSEICKMRFFAAEYPILIIDYYQTAKTGVLYESSDGPAG